MSDEELQEFTQELIAPFSIHRKKYARPHGTVARRQFANRVNKRLKQLVELEVEKALTAYKKNLAARHYDDITKTYDYDGIAEEVLSAIQKDEEL